MLRFYDSFSHYNNAIVGQKWDVIQPGSGNNTCTQFLTGGRFGLGRLNFAARENDGQSMFQYAQRNYSGQATIIVSCALRQTTTQITGTQNFSGSGGRWLSFMDGATLQVGLQILPSGQIRAIRNNVAGDGYTLNTAASPQCTTLGTSTNSISSSSFDFLEVKVVHNAATGSITINRNGSLFWSLTNVNTAISGVNNSSSVIVGGYTQIIGGTFNYVGLNVDVSDFNIIDTVAGSDPRDLVDFAGDMHGEQLTPTADGNYTEWTPNPAGTHFSNISTIPPDTTKKNSTGTVGNRDTFVVSSSVAPTTAAVKAVVLTMYIQKDSGGLNGVSGMMRQAGVDGLGGEFQVPSPYAFRQSFIFSKPAGGAILVSDVNASQFGYKRTS